MTLTSQYTPGVFTAVESINCQGGSNIGIHEESTEALTAATNSSGNNLMATMCNMTVRRLTTVECARLQGFPDHFTEIPWRGKSPDQCPKAPQYKAYGNSMCVNVIEWLGRVIEGELEHPSGVELEPPPEQLEFDF